MKIASFQKKGMNMVSMKHFVKVTALLVLAQVLNLNAAPADSLSDEEKQAGWKVIDRKSTRLNSSHIQKSRMPSSA